MLELFFTILLIKALLIIMLGLYTVLTAFLIVIFLSLGVSFILKAFKINCPPLNYFMDYLDETLEWSKIYRGLRSGTWILIDLGNKQSYWKRLKDNEPTPNNIIILKKETDYDDLYTYYMIDVDLFIIYIMMMIYLQT